MNHLGNLAHCYTKLGKHKQAIDLHRRLLKIISLQHGESSEHTFSIISSLALALHKAGEMSEAKDLLREHIPVAERTFGREHDMTIGLRWTYANLLREDAANGETLASDLVDAFRTFESIAELWRRQRPKNDPDLMGIEKTLKLAGDDLNRLAGGRYGERRGEVSRGRGGRNRPARNAIGARGSVRMNETDGDLRARSKFRGSKHREA